jgi:hypothetical protein
LALHGEPGWIICEAVTKCADTSFDCCKNISKRRPEKSVDLSKTVALLAVLLMVALALGQTLSPGASEALAASVVQR